MLPPGEKGLCERTAEVGVSGLVDSNDGPPRVGSVSGSFLSRLSLLKTIS